MPREHWAFLLDPLMEAMRGFDFNGRRLDVRENVAFQGKGEQTRFVHERYPGEGCAIALEFKKFFMDEWTGEPDPAELEAMRDFITFSAATARATAAMTARGRRTADDRVHARVRAATARFANRSATAAASISIGGCHSSSSIAPTEPRVSLARRVAVESPAYLIWSAGDDAAALAAMRRHRRPCAEKGPPAGRHPRRPSVELAEDGSPALPQFVARLGAGDKGDVGRAAGVLEEAMRDDRDRPSPCKVERVPFAPHAAGEHSIDALERIDGVERLIPQRAANPSPAGRRRLSGDRA